MRDHQRSGDDSQLEALAELTRKLDTIAGAVAAIASTQSDLLAHTAEVEARRAQDSYEVSQRLAALERQSLAGGDTGAGEGSAALADTAEQLGDRLTLHTDLALAGAIRLIDSRFEALREALAGTTAHEGGIPSGATGFEAGAVMGAVQAAWTRLEHRLETEFDDVGRQLEAMATLIEQAASSAEEAAAHRPVVTGDQIRRAASSVKDTVLSAGRTRRDRRGGPRSLGSGTVDGSPVTPTSPTDPSGS